MKNTKLYGLFLAVILGVQPVAATTQESGDRSLKRSASVASLPDLDDDNGWLSDGVFDEEVVQNQAEKAQQRERYLALLASPVKKQIASPIKKQVELGAEPSALPVLPMHGQEVQLESDLLPATPPYEQVAGLRTPRKLEYNQLPERSPRAQGKIAEPRTPQKSGGIYSPRTPEHLATLRNNKSPVHKRGSIDSPEDLQQYLAPADRRVIRKIHMESLVKKPVPLRKKNSGQCNLAATLLSRPVNGHTKRLEKGCLTKKIIKEFATVDLQTLENLDLLIKALRSYIFIRIFTLIENGVCDFTNLSTVTEALVDQKDPLTYFFDIIYYRLTSKFEDERWVDLDASFYTGDFFVPEDARPEFVRTDHLLNQYFSQPVDSFSLACDHMLLLFRIIDNKDYVISSMQAIRPIISLLDADPYLSFRALIATCKKHIETTTQSHKYMRVFLDNSILDSDGNTVTHVLAMCYKQVLQIQQANETLLLQKKLCSEILAKIQTIASLMVQITESLNTAFKQDAASLESIQDQTYIPLSLDKPNGCLANALGITPTQVAPELVFYEGSLGEALPFFALHDCILLSKEDLKNEQTLDEYKTAIDILSDLLQHPACNPNLMDLEGNTVLHLACASLCPELVECILVHTKRWILNVNAQNKLGETCLHSILEALIKHSKCSDGNSKKNRACCIMILKMLFERAGSINFTLKNSFGLCLFDLLKSLDDQEINTIFRRVCVQRFESVEGFASKD